MFSLELAHITKLAHNKLNTYDDSIVNNANFRMSKYKLAHNMFATQHKPQH